MSSAQITIVAIVLVMVALFVWGRWRHDFVAVAALIACVVAGLVPAPAAFAGFGHPAVVTVAAVLVLSGVLQSTGAATILARTFVPQAAGPMPTMAALALLAAVLSAFMNNVGALALLMPVALQVAARQGQPAGKLLMPVAFASILGGMITMIGTPPNLIVSGFRAETGAGTFGMFDFTPVGLAVAGAGIAFIVLVGWRLVPGRERAGAEGFETGAYLTEVVVPEKSRTVGSTLREVEVKLDEAGAQIIGLVRNDVRIAAPHGRRTVRAGDVLVIEADPDALSEVLSVLELRLEADRSEQEQADNDREAGGDAAREPDGQASAEDDESSPARDEEIVLLEVALLPGSALTGRSVTEVQLRDRYGINLLAVSRQGQKKQTRLRNMRLDAGDVLLLQGDREALGEFASQFGAVPLADRPLQIPRKREAMLAGGVLALGVAAAAFGLVPAALAFTAAALLAMLLNLVSARRFYDAIDWPVIILLGALLPVAEAMARSGAAELLAQLLVRDLARGHAVVALALTLIVTMTLSDFMNNAATAAVMCPIAIGIAASLGASPDAFLMAVAVGASCAFLTPIGHQNNTLILGPGGFRFGDYWRMGLPVEILVVAVAVPMLLRVWPL